MNIIIGGAGAVGVHVAKLLSREHHDIVVIDADPKRIALLADDYDLMVINEMPSSIEALKAAGAAHADLFIGVMPDEAVNMTCCMLAHRLGTRKTVARVDNYEYTQAEYREFFDSVGISSIIFPEMLAAEDILQSVKFTWIRQWWEVRGGSLVMIGVKLRANAEILDTPLRELSSAEDPYHVVAIKRGNETLIPHGNDILMENDVAYFMTTKKYVDYIKRISGKTAYSDVRSMVIMGISSTTIQLLRNLPPDIYTKVIDKDEERCEMAASMFSGHNIMFINGDARDLELMHEENIDKTDAFLALTGNAEQNILACLAAKRAGVAKTVAMVENLDYVSMAEGFDIGTIINKKTIAASRIYQMLLRADVSNVKSLTIASADVAEFEVKEGSKITRKPVKDLGLPETVNLGGLVRDGESMLINGMTTIKPGDRVTVFCFENEIKRVEKYFR